MNVKILLSVGVVSIISLGLFALNKPVSVIASNSFDQKAPAANELATFKVPVLETSQTATIISPKLPLNIDTPSISPIERFRNQAVKTELKTRLVEEHDQFTRYPSENRAFENEQQDPVKQRYDVDERTTMSDDHSMGLTIWSDEKFYLLNDTVNVFAHIQDAEGKKLATTFNSTLIYDEKDILGEIQLKDENGDGTYHGAITLTQQNTFSKGPGIYKVRIQDIKNQLTDSLTFTFSQPDIYLTGEYKEKIDNNGNLLIDAEVNVSANSNFYIQASLYSSTNVAIGITQFSQQLTTGSHWVPLSFSGLMIQDANEAGPYVLKNVSVAKVTMPMQRGPLVEPDFQTDSYALDEFGN